MNSYPPSWVRAPEVLGEWLASHVRSAHNTNERLGHVARADAVCWFLCQVGYLAKAKDVKRFATAFRGRFAVVRTWDPVGRKIVVNVEALDMCYSLLNTCYGGVSRDFGGQPCVTWGGKENNYKHYGVVAPLYRSIPRHYSPTIGGLRRAARVQSMLDAIVSQS